MLRTMISLFWRSQYTPRATSLLTPGSCVPQLGIERPGCRQEGTSSDKVVITGHSLAAAIALLDSLYLPLHLPTTITFTTTVFGLPRAGNPAFAANGADQSMKEIPTPS